MSAIEEGFGVPAGRGEPSCRPRGGGRPTAMDTELASKLLAAAWAGDAAETDVLARAAYHGRPGHPVLLERRLLDHVIELDGDTGARPLLEGDHVFTWEVGRLCDPTDIDTPERLQEVQS